MGNYNNNIEKYLATNNILGTFNNYYSAPTINKAYQDIKNNRTIRVDNIDYYFKKVLRESDLLVISIGMEELTKNYSKMDMSSNNNYFNKMYNDILRLIKVIKKYAYGKIIFIGYYNPTNYYDANVDQLFYDMNTRLKKIMHENGIIYIDLYKKKKENKDINRIIVDSIITYLS